MEVSAAGGHNMLMMGPPGTGKTMLASRICSILPPMDNASALEIGAIRSIANVGFDLKNWRIPPFRAPHHTASAVALVGGGSTLKVGEISLAHKGVLFLDELPEFSPKVLQVMREPMESGHISISRAGYQVKLPAQFQLIAAMNPCPCGYLGDPDRVCRCSAEKVRQYRSRISGPLLDRIDLQIHVDRLREEDKEQLFSVNTHLNGSSAAIRARVSKARQRQLDRAGTTNACLNQQEIQQFCRLSK